MGLSVEWKSTFVCVIEMPLLHGLTGAHVRKPREDKFLHGRYRDPMARKPNIAPLGLDSG